MNAVIYTPIDIKFDVPDEQELLAWFDENQITDDYPEKKNGRHEWAVCACRGEPADWRSYKCWTENWFSNRNYVEGIDLVFNPSFEKQFPSIAEMIRQLPFIQLAGAAMLKQIGEIPAHMDTFDHHVPPEPSKYRAYLTDPQYNTFYLNKDKDKIFPTIDNDYRLFCFNNVALTHGAVVNTAPKILLTMTGIMDVEKHKELLKRSIDKFSDKVLYEQDLYKRQ